MKTVDSGWRWRLFVLAWALVAGGSLVGVAVAHEDGFLARTDFPGRRLSEELTRRYEELHGVPPAVVAGDWWLAGNVCVHSRHRPALYGSLEPSCYAMWVPRSRGELRAPERFFEPDPLASPWISDEDLARCGGILVWDADTFGADLPPSLRRRFPQAEVRKGVCLRYLANPKMMPVYVGWATIPPAR